MEFAKPELLWLFLIYVPLIIWYIKKHKNAESSVQISSLGAFDKMPVSYKVYLRHIMFVVKLAAIGCLIIILCRPQTHDSWESSKTEGTDIILAMDVSTSMLARDFDPDRFEAAKDVASQFVSGRESDNIGIVIFAGESFTLVPMTTDKAVLVNYIKEIKMGMLQDGTAIGDGLATSINRIRNGKAKSKSIILLTDGSNNTGVVATLKSISERTGGKYFRATSKTVLKDIFSEIDKLEKTELDVRKFNQTEDDYMVWALILLALVAVDIIVRHTVLRNIP